MKKLSVLVSILLIFTLVFTACSNSNSANIENQTNDAQSQDNSSTDTQKPQEKQNVNIIGLKGPTSIGMIKLIDEKALNSDLYNVEYTTVDAPDVITGKLINNEVQIAAVPTNLAAMVYNKTNGNVQFLALNTLGVLYAVGKDDNISTLADLEGKKVAISGQGAVPEYAMYYMLSQEGLTDKVQLQFMPDHATVAQALLAGDIDVAILPEPFVTKVTMNSETYKILIDLNKVWNQDSKGESVLAMGCLVVNKTFADNNKQFISDFLTKYEESVNFVNEKPAEAGKLVKKNEIIDNDKLVEAAIPNCSIVYKSAQDAKSEINAFLKILYDSNSKSVGGKLPDESFYYNN